MKRFLLKLRRPSIKLTFLFAILSNFLLWQLLIPIWHFPDEQAHFGQVAFRADRGRVQRYHELSTSREIFVSEELLGTRRDGRGNNRFTYHPEFKIDYSKTYDGPHEVEIESLNNLNDRITETLEEATRYPLLYYYFASKIYNLFGAGDLFTRVYAVRFFSILIFIVTTSIIFATSKLVFPKNFFLQISLTSIIAFLPMFVFSSSGVSSDGLFNLLFMFSIYLIAKNLFVKCNWKDTVLLSAIIIAGIATKIQFQIVWLLIFYALFVIFLRLQLSRKLIFLGSIVLSFPIILIVVNFLYFFANDFGSPQLRQLIRLPIIPETSEGSTLGPIAQITLSNHFILTVKRSFRETLPWYFGVYKWLSLTLPPLVYQIVNRILVLSLIGIFVWISKVIRRQKFDQQAKVLIFLAYSAISYFGALTLFDWLFYKYHAFYFGIQGRYFFPTIIAHFSFIFVGLLVLFPKSFKKWAAATLVVVTIIFNYFSLFWVAAHYYDVGSLNTFITQASQYKPEIFKGLGIILILLLSITSMIYFLYEYSKVFVKTKPNNYP